MQYIRPAVNMTDGSVIVSSPGGRSTCQVLPIQPSIGIVAYRLTPEAKAVPVIKAMVCTASMVKIPTWLSCFVDFVLAADCDGKFVAGVPCR